MRLTPAHLSATQVCAFSEALAEGAVKMGLPSGLAHRIAAQTLLVRGASGKSRERGRWASRGWATELEACISFLQGTARMLLQGGQHPAQLRTDVCTPGGTTIHGLHALERGGLRAAVMDAVEAATCRARELSKK